MLPPHTFLRIINKKGKQTEKKSFHAETIKRVSPRSKCVIIERLEFRIFSCRLIMVADNTFQRTMVPSL